MRGLILSLFTDKLSRKRPRYWPGGEHALAMTDEVTLVGWVDNETDIVSGKVNLIEGPFEACASRPAVIVVRRPHLQAPYLRLAPGYEPGGWAMASDVYASTSDSRLKDYVGGNFYGAIAVHDRYERSSENIAHLSV